MPRLTDASKQARRDTIVRAAVRVLERNGVANTSIAQIVEESGLSAGSIYSHFENKAELALYIADATLGWRIDRVDELTADGGAPTPIAVLRRLLGFHDEQPPPLAVLMQFWGEAAIDPELHAVLTGKITKLLEAFERAVTPWALGRVAGASEDGDEDAAALAQRTARAMVAISQGFLANAALFGWFGAEEYLDVVGGMFGGDAE